MHYKNREVSNSDERKDMHSLRARTHTHTHTHTHIYIYIYIYIYKSDF
jgi:hypothetical protein